MWYLLGSECFLTFTWDFMCKGLVLFISVTVFWPSITWVSRESLWARPSTSCRPPETRLHSRSRRDPNVSVRIKTCECVLEKCMQTFLTSSLIPHQRLSFWPTSVFSSTFRVGQGQSVRDGFVRERHGRRSLRFSQEGEILWTSSPDHAAQSGFSHGLMG